MSEIRDHRRFNKFSRKHRSGAYNFGFAKRQNCESSVENRGTLCYLQDRLSEKEVGILEYIGSVSGFSGVIKARYSDFHVNEINEAGEIAKLTEMSAPADFYADDKQSAESEPLARCDLISEEQWDRMSELRNLPDDSVFEIDLTLTSKDERTKMHEAIKKRFGYNVIASTKTKDDKKILEVRKYTKAGLALAEKRNCKWPAGKGEYVHFLVYKEAMDTLTASFKISTRLRIRSASITYAGMKDRRAKTTQWFCVHKVDPQRLLKCTKFLRGLHLGNITFKNQPLRLGQLSGNRFRMVLRNVIADDSVIQEAMVSLQNNGFINYYGLQRFGYDKEVPTFLIGLKLMQGNWKEACELILKPKTGELIDSDIVRAKRVYKDTSNAELAYKEFSKKNNKCLESLLLLGLAKNNKNDYVNALEKIPRNMRLLYIHSFQSFIWNKIVSQRIKVFGLQPIVGDIVLLSEASKQSNEMEESNESDESSDAVHQEIKILTKEDLNNYTIYDVCLPLPGYDIRYPENQIKDWYVEILNEYSLTIEMPKQKVKTYTLSGSYRKIVGRVKNLSWKTMKYAHPNDLLIRSDYEELIGESEAQETPEGQYKALFIDFCLNSSSYATMVLREILKIDTSSATHAKLNNYHEVGEKQEASGREFAQTDSLLSDANKYEAFKQQIFGTQSENDGPKRKAEDESDELTTVKKIKTAVEEPTFSIKTQPGLV